MLRYDFYYGQKVRESELDDAFDAVEDALAVFLQGFGLNGILNGADVTEHNPTPNFTVDVSGPALVYDQLAQKIAWATTENVDCTVDENGTATAVSTSGNEKYLSIFAEFVRDASDPRTDRNGATVFFVNAESYAINVVQGVEAPTGTAVKPSLRSDQVLLGDVLITYGMTQIQNSDIDLDRAEYPYDITGSPFSVKEKNLLDVLQAMLDEYNGIFGVAHTWTAQQTFSGSVPIRIYPAASPTLANNGDIALDTTGNDRLIARINGVDRDVAQAQQSRTLRLSSASGVPVGTDWSYLPTTSNKWRSQNIDGSTYRMAFPLNGVIPWGSTITEISVYVTPDGTSTGTDRFLVEFYQNVYLVDSAYHDGSASAQWVTITGLSEVVGSNNTDYRIVIRAQLATSGSGYNEIEGVNVDFTDGAFARVQ